MDKIKQWWSNFLKEKPVLAKWIREGGLFVLISQAITIVRGLFIPMFANLLKGWLGTGAAGFPGITVSFFGLFDFDWYIIGASESEGGRSYFCALLVSLWIFEIINFFLQRRFTFRSNGNIARQFALYFLTFIVVTCVVFSANSIWLGLSGFVGIPDWIVGIVTSFITGGVAMVVYFFVNRYIFKDSDSAK